MARPSPGGRILQLFSGGQALAASAVAASLAMSRQAAQRQLAALVAGGKLVSEGRGPALRYRSAGSLPAVYQYPRAVIAEDRVWDEISTRHPAIGGLPDRARSITQYAFTEILNNAIEHSRGTTVSVRIHQTTAGLSFEIADDGVGIFENLKKLLGFKSELEALQQVSKGKLTTLPKGHTGEGIFFTSKAVRCFRVESDGLTWTMDNAAGDSAVGSAIPKPGTRVTFEIDRRPRRTLAQVFAEYTEDFEFAKTRVVVKLFAVGVRFISRSEARRLLQGLERFRTVVLDFKSVEEVGQGFVDEVFRVWARQHPTIVVTPTNMNTPIAFMVNRARHPSG